MNRVPSYRRCTALTALEVVVLIACLALLVVLIASAFMKPTRNHAPRIQCVSNLKQVGWAFQLFANDHGEKFPCAVSTSQGGSAENRNSLEVFRHFQAASNELNSPRILVCPSDHARSRAITFFSNFSNGNLSYFVALESEETTPSGLLAGDRNITTNGRLMSGFLLLSSHSPAGWTSDLHSNVGNIALSDGSVVQTSQTSLRTSLQWRTNFSTRLAIP